MFIVRLLISSVVLLLTRFVGAEQNTSVVTLNDENFEHLTQATTGSTTGKWFIKFYAPWCGHCQAMAPTWEQLSEKIADEHADQGIVIAKVDMTANPRIQNRFDVPGYPTLKLITGGKMYNYEGPRTLTDLAEFALGGYKDATTVEAVPPDVTQWKKFIDQLQKHEFIRVTWVDFEHILDYRKNAALILFFMGTAFGLILSYTYSALVSSTTRRNKSKKD